mmetsp:Transcript_6667/g.9672  ORF Transcript_6667/g.9672 Transcript_6667/m.9672 type:complete len:371 (-) Transcript_6667:42-1154(-)|eukprot:CAMPEP_0172416976 /NCGR_PEP_ID=MMETSP1064-20121228/3493_1 /TAXON_ID=202472 /ORGANISM="Aulacoseira subarctica , Strain CCAP 1002/5" /LENGTH=370 /DNA_ID=CAMNT_0013155001 /DNA_START=153 /DNA_END=1265 /DNA_ORIENTATION=+
MPTIPAFARLPVSVLGLYTSFILWGYLQERLSSTDYARLTPDQDVQKSGHSQAKWTFVFVLNCCMAFASFFTSLPFVVLGVGAPPATAREPIVTRLTPHAGLAVPALSNALASPFGYLSLRYINYPMLLLVKSSKLVPVMFLSWLLNGKKYNVAQIASVILISLGVALFSCKVNPISLISGSSSLDKDQSSVDTHGIFQTIIGLCLVSINLFVDGFTNAKQDRFRDKNPTVSSFQMMYETNLWQFVFMSFYLIVEALLKQMNVIPYSQLYSAIQFMIDYPTVVTDVVMFSLCGAIGQVFIFYIIASFGSLTCVLVTVTRKFFSILLSILVFGHSVQYWQWLGVGAVFTGLFVNSLDTYYAKSKKQKSKKE